MICGNQLVVPPIVNFFRQHPTGWPLLVKIVAAAGEGGDDGVEPNGDDAGRGVAPSSGALHRTQGGSLDQVRGAAGG